MARLGGIMNSKNSPKSSSKKSTKPKATKVGPSKSSTPGVRLQKYIADCGITSRRKAEEFITQGRVSVNGEVVMELGTKVDPAADVIMVDGALADLQAVEKIYVYVHKPRGYVTTLNDPEGRRTVMDLVKDIPERIYPVGRLDYLSEGLLIMTNDGDVANMIMHPKYDVTKIYEVKVFGSVTDAILTKLKAGALIDEGFVKPQSVRIVKQLPSKTWLEFRLNEGKNREIRKLCEAVGLTVDKLKRVAIENLTIEGVAPGKYRVLTKPQLMNALGLNNDGSKNLKAPKYMSPKKTIDISRKGAQPGTEADSEAFQKFRRESYFETVKTIKENKEKMAQRLTSLELEVKEDKFQKTRTAKIAKLKKAPAKYS